MGDGDGDGDAASAMLRRNIFCEPSAHASD
jgi:hypothetical protein